MKQLVDYRRQAWNCYRDNMCKSVFSWHLKSDRFSAVCPSLEKYRFDAFSAQGRLDIARAMIEGELEWSERLLDTIYRCQLCGACDYICGRVKEMQPTRVIQAMRIKLVKEGKAPPPEFRQLNEAMRTYLNPYGRANSQRGKWILNREIADGDATKVSRELRVDTLLYVGCSPLRDVAAELMPQAALRILQRAGIDIGILGDKEVCCGHPSLCLGDEENFIAFAKENVRLFHELNVKRLVCLCPLCLSTFRRDYPELGVKIQFETVHFTEYLDQLIKSGAIKLTKEVCLDVAYHDPCHLGRISNSGVSGTNSFIGIYEPPRSILKAIPGVNLKEMPRNRDDSWCCGAGGWMKMSYPDFAIWTGVERVEEARSTGAQALVTCCPHCHENLSEACRVDPRALEIVDLLDLVLRAM